MSLKVFQTTVNHYRSLGVYISQAFEKNSRINIKLVIAYFFLCQFFFTTGTFFFIGADTFGDYTDSLYWSATSLTTISLLSIIILKKKNLFNLFDGYEKTIAIRK